MKKILMTTATAVLACAVSISAAETVTSANIVGYSKDVSPATSFHISGYQFVGSAATPADVYGSSLPVGSKIYSFNGTGYEIATFSEEIDFGTWPFVTNYVWIGDAISLDSASGYWIENTGVSAATSILSGEVPLADSITNATLGAFQMLSYPYPISRAVEDLGIPASVNDKVYAWNGGGYDIATFAEEIDFGTWPFTTNYLWVGDAITLDVGEGFWLEAQNAGSWIVERPFTP